MLQLETITVKECNSYGKIIFHALVFIISSIVCISPFVFAYSAYVIQEAVIILQKNLLN